MNANAPTLLVVDDEPNIREVIGKFAARAGFQVNEAASAREALSRLNERHIDVALVDLCMPELGGLDLLRALRQEIPRCRTIVMTGLGSIDTAVEAMKEGAVDYFQKPVDFPRLAKILRGIRKEVQVAGASAAANAVDGAQYGIVGHSEAIRDLVGRLQRLAEHARAVLVTGETGTGKELVASALHRLGSRRSKPYVPVNCSAVVETLVESELFGHMRGAFTGATDNKPGLFEAAHGGTLFLDEVGELPMQIQAKLLRVLESGEIRRLGSLEARTVDVHVIAATNRDLQREIADSRFRQDLYYRLGVIALHVPPLRERTEDIPRLAAKFVADVGSRLGRPFDGLSPMAERMLCSRDWPGNVRELRNVIERACILADGRLITDRDIAEAVPPSSSTSVGPAPARRVAVAGPRPVVTKEDIEQALAKAHGNKMVAAQIVGLSRRAFYRQLEHWGLDDTITRRPRQLVISD
jgi:DNA-binding NtrC family response regulator